MGYEGNDRRYGSGRDDQDRNRSAYGSRGDYGNYGGSGARDYRGDRFNDRERGGYGGGRDDDRGFFDRAGDEVRSWFGDEDAERRRRQDDRERGYDRGRADYGQSNYGRSSYGQSAYGRSDQGRQSGSASGELFGNDQRQSGGRHDHDPHYRTWRDRQMEALDRDYDEYHREKQTRFDSEFGTWRQGRQGQRDQLTKVQEHAEVVGSDGQHVGTVDHVRGDHILLTKNDQDAGGRHHSIPSSWIQSVDGDKVTIGKTADQAKAHWRDEQRNDDDRGGLFGRDRDAGTNNLNRSFSGTY